MNEPKNTKKMDRRDFIKKGIQMAGAGVLATGLTRCNLLLDETTGGGLLLKGDCGKILYQNGSNNLFILDLNRDFRRSQVGTITVNGTGDFSISSDYSIVVYVPSGTTTQLWTVSANGSNAIGPLATSVSGSPLATPRYSFNSSKIIYEETGGTAGTGIYTMNGDGSSATLIRNDGTNFESNPSWSPDDSQVAFIIIGTATNIFTMDSSTGTSTGLPNANVSTTSRPSWSSNGTKLIYERAGNIEVADINVNYNGGTGGTGVSLGIAGTSPHWSPTGEQFAYVSGGQIYIADSDGSNSKPCPGVSGAVALEWR